MKKMMMTLAIVLAAVAGNAASVNWSSGNMSTLAVNGEGTYATVWQGQVMSYFLVGSAAYDQTSVIAALQAGGTTALPAGADFSKALGGTPTFAANGTGASTAFANGEYAYGYAVVFDQAGDHFAISKVGTSAVFAAGANSTLNVGPIANYTVYAVVPEPTSMALLALGVAALGLRRRFKK